MEKLPKNSLLEFHSSTLQDVRNHYSLDDPKRLDEAIDILQEWARKQTHFTVTEFERDFLERMIITNKGLLERCKKRLDKICTLRTLMPEFFLPVDVKTMKSNMECLNIAIMPKLTEENYRVYMLKNFGKQFSSTFFMDVYKVLISMWQYMMRHDYHAGFIIVYDMSEANLVDVMTSINLTEFRQIATIIMEGYGARIKDIYCISSSKLMKTLVDLLKPMVSKKLGDRVQIIEDKNLLKEKISVEILPSDYGGKEKSLPELHQDWFDELSSEDHMEFMKKMSESKTNEAMRQTDKFNEEYLGMPGTFRSLSVD
ncbi:uncharacterized protein LOC106129868 [Amyelois transitella]|uniref:uncharacterized protein LOC106129868 n=1 Tax=Amyelois transitella TaxID=680683 RepID=UPI00299052B4|nr:uncharacterized protein LOC106129868 [Amyelois transitella]